MQPPATGAKHWSREGPSRAGAPHTCRGTMCPPSAPQPPKTLLLSCPLLRASQRTRSPRPCSHLFPWKSHSFSLCWGHATGWGSQHKSSITPTPHPGWPQQHPQALPALGAAGTGLGTIGHITAGFTRREKDAPSGVPLHTHPTGLHTGRHQTGTLHVWACSVPPSHPVTVPAGLKGAGTQGMACSQPWGERGDTLILWLPPLFLLVLHKHMEQHTSRMMVHTKAATSLPCSGSCGGQR